MIRPLIVAVSVAALSAQAQPPAVPPAQPACAEMAAALQAVMRNDARLRDWPELARYRAANAALPAPASGESRVVFMGDSITDSWQQARYGFFNTGKPYINRGISGQTTPQMLVRFRPDVIALQPKAVVILAGTNDLSENTGPATDEEIEGNLRSMAELARASGITVVLASITPTSAYHAAANRIPQSTLRPMSRIRTINRWMQQYATANGHVYLDYFSAMIDAAGVMKSELTNDDLHPNAAGYAVMAPLAEAAIQRALARR